MSEIRTRPTTDEYRDGYDLVEWQKKDCAVAQEEGRPCGGQQNCVEGENGGANPPRTLFSALRTMFDG